VFAVALLMGLAYLFITKMDMTWPKVNEGFQQLLVSDPQDSVNSSNSVSFKFLLNLKKSHLC
jgi:hypothetical protein